MATHGYTCATPFFLGFTHGYTWLHMATHGYTCVTPFFGGLHMATHGYTWLHMATHGYTSTTHLRNFPRSPVVWPEVLPLSGRDGGSMSGTSYR